MDEELQVNDVSCIWVVSDTVAATDAPFRLAVSVTVVLLVKLPAVAVNEAEVAAAAILIDGGAGRSGLLLERVTVTPPPGAALFRETVHEVDPPEATPVGLQTRDVSTSEALSDTVAVAELPFKLAVMVALPLVVKLPAAAVNEPVVVDAIVIDAGTGNAGLLLAREMATPFPGAALLSVTVHTVLAPGPTVAGTQFSSVISNCEVRETVAVTDCPFRLAVIVAEPSLVKLPAVAVNEAEAAPGAMVRDAGTGSSGLLVESETVTPFPGATLFRETVQEVDPPDGTPVGLQASDVSTCGVLSDTVALAELPFKLPVMVALPSVVKLPAPAVNEPVVVEAIVIDGGTGSTGLLLARETATPLPGAALLSVTVHTVLAPGPTVAGTQFSSVISNCEVRETVAVTDCPFRVAVSVAELSLVKLPAVAAKEADVALGAMMRDAGAGRSGLLLESKTVTPLPGAPLFSETVQVVPPPGPTMGGTQLKDWSCGGATSDRVAVCELFFKVAVTVAL
jgi:hypothetical protein